MRPRLGQRGDTLIEIIMATAILTFVLISSYAVASRATRLGQEARERSVAANVAQEQIEALRNYRDNSTDWGNSTGPGFTNHIFSGNAYYMNTTSVQPTAGQNTGDSRLPAGGKVWFTGLYSLKFGSTSANEYDFSVHVTWIGNNGQQDSTVVYSRLADLSALRPH